ncbi:tetratricopeptide repeat protein [Bacteroidota bacterium]
MKTSIDKFENELDGLLKRYFNDDELSRLNKNIVLPKNGSDKLSGMINDFYRNQLQIEIHNCSERIRIDRTVTFSEKKLPADKLYRFLLDLSQLCLSRGRLNLANELFKKVKRTSNNKIFKAESLMGLADVFSRRADWQRSLVTIEEAESIYIELNDNSGLAKCENVLGSIYGERGELSKSKDYFLNALSLLNPDKDLELAANLEMNLGILENIRENTDEAIKHLTNALASYNKLGNKRRITETKHNIGMVYLDLGDYKSAIAALDEAIEIAKEGSFLSILCIIYLAKSQALIAMDDLYYASEFADKALDISNSTDDKLTAADSYRVKGIIERSRKNYNTAETYLLTSLRINTKLKNDQNIASTSLELAALYEEKNNAQSKKSYLTSALNYFKRIKAYKEVKKIEDMLGIGTA